MESPTGVLTTYCLLKDYGRREIRHSCRALEIYIKREIRETFLIIFIRTKIEVIIV